MLLYYGLEPGRAVAIARATNEGLAEFAARRGHLCSSGRTTRRGDYSVAVRRSPRRLRRAPGRPGRASPRRPLEGLLRLPECLGPPGARAPSTAARRSQNSHTPLRLVVSLRSRGRASRKGAAAHASCLVRVRAARCEHDLAPCEAAAFASVVVVIPACRPSASSDSISARSAATRDSSRAPPARNPSCTARSRSRIRSLSDAVEVSCRGPRSRHHSLRNGSLSRLVRAVGVADARGERVAKGSQSR